MEGSWLQAREKSNVSQVQREADSLRQVTGYTVEQRKLPPRQIAAPHSHPSGGLLAFLKEIQRVCKAGTGKS